MKRDYPWARRWILEGETLAEMSDDRAGERKVGTSRSAAGLDWSATGRAHLLSNQASLNSRKGAGSGSGRLGRPGKQRHSDVSLV